MDNIMDCQGYKMLREKADENIAHGWGEERVNKGFNWAIERAKHYSEKLNLPINDILTSWVNQCNISFLNYFQDCNQPLIEHENVKVFETIDELLQAIGEKKFRCPSCGGISTSPYECNARGCNWKVYGLFGDLGKGAYVFIKDKLSGERIFMPLSWENSTQAD